MKPYINLFTGICLSLAVIFLIGMDGCDTEEAAPPVAFLSATPPTGSTIQKDTTIIATFDGAPVGLSVTGGKFSLAGSTATIVGPFSPGSLGLVLSWTDGAMALTYTVSDPTGATVDSADLPPPPEGMVLIPAGEFEMGSNDAEALNNEQPVRKVYVDAFYMNETEVTNVQFKEFLIENPRWQKGRIEKRFADERYLHLWSGNNYPNGKGNHPVTWVSWYAAMAYAEWAGKRLPTEAEWERAARGGLSKKKYPHGNAITARDANYGGNVGVGDTTAVGRYPANKYGLYDMVGNAAEWCLDEYDSDFYFTFPRNGVARNPLSGANSVEWLVKNFTNVTMRVLLRGGSWADTARFVRVSRRRSTSQTYTFVGFGFRCVSSVSP